MNLHHLDAIGKLLALSRKPALIGRDHFRIAHDHVDDVVALADGDRLPPRVARKALPCPAHHATARAPGAAS